MKRREAESFTKERIEEFLEDFTRLGRSQPCVQSYRRALTGLYDVLPEIRPDVPFKENERTLDRETGRAWVEWMKAEGLSPRTVNARISAWNSFVKHIGRQEWKLERADDSSDEGERPELSRSEYLRLLSTAKHLGKDRTYMLVKTFGDTGLRVQELPLLTAEAVLSGKVPLEERGQELKLAPTLRRELMAYLQRQGIRSGPVFVTSGGNPMPRSAINASIRQLSMDARVGIEKVTPSCLRNMYEDTQKGLWSRISLLVDQAYEALLQQEEIAVGWEE